MGTELFPRLEMNGERDTCWQQMFNRIAMSAKLHTNIIAGDPFLSLTEGKKLLNCSVLLLSSVNLLSKACKL
jgi:hypothetical protein